jgi:hypothetical protein
LFVVDDLQAMPAEEKERPGSVLCGLGEGPHARVPLDQGLGTDRQGGLLGMAGDIRHLLDLLVGGCQQQPALGERGVRVTVALGQPGEESVGRVCGDLQLTEAPGLAYPWLSEVLRGRRALVEVGIAADADHDGEGAWRAFLPAGVCPQAGLVDLGLQAQGVLQAFCLAASSLAANRR